MVEELRPRKSRPRTHRPRTRSRTRSEMQIRPKTTRVYAPISYTDLSICYDSSTSNEGSPVRYMFHNLGGYRMKALNPPDQYSLSTIQAARFSHLDFSSDLKFKVVPKVKVTDYHRTPHIEILNVPPKPCLTIIDFNQLTRGGLDEAKGKRYTEKHVEKEKEVNMNTRNKSHRSKK